VGRLAHLWRRRYLINEYTCPITAEIMTDPVNTLDGFTYERTAITE
tara:strand:- start:332 stop:469 length:138 start_codon:yes stop_codon:yes gene_type:complete